MPKTNPQRPLIDPKLYIPHFLSLINNQLSSGASDLYLRLFGIGLNEWRVISSLVKYPGCLANDIAQLMGIHKAVVSRSLRFLENMKVVRLKLVDRQRLVFLTPHGEQLHDQIAEVAFKREQLLLNGISPRDVAKLRQLLSILLANIPTVNSYVPPHVGKL